MHILGLSITLLAIVGLSVYSGRSAKKQAGAGTFLSSGIIMGTLVGGSSTVGTAQLAFHFGMSAWWFTLGGGIACLILALFYVKPLKSSGCSTLTSIINKEYGPRSGMTASVLSSIGTFINILAQLISATAIIAVVLPELHLVPSILIAAVFMVLYVIFGGTRGSGMVGILKMCLLYVAMVACGGLVLWKSGGLGGFNDLVNAIPNPENVPFYSPFARGIGKDLSACLSLVLGVITTQAYAQAIFAAKGAKQARGGALISSVLITVMGIGGILVGLYMRATHPDIVAKTALTLFVTEYMPPLLGGVVLGALFIAAVGTGSGLALGIATVLRNDVLPRLAPKIAEKSTPRSLERALILLILVSATLLCLGPLGDMILNFSFLSMGLRGTTVFLPLCCALWLPGRIRPGFAMAAIIAGPLVVLVFGLWNVLPFDSLFAGVLATCFIMAAGWQKKRENL